MTKVYKFLRLITYATLMVCTCLLTSCVTESVPDNNKRGNFEALWQTLNTRYCFSTIKGGLWSGLGQCAQPLCCHDKRADD